MASSGISMSRPEELAPMQAAKHTQYREMLQTEKAGSTIKFWNVVLITASDEEQAAMYRDQIEWRKELGFIPRCAQYFVLPDPPGAKIGNGGATLVALDFLRTKFGDSLKELRVLLIHAGGYSTRTPHHSVCGKIFAPLPVGPFPGSSMLEMCFAMLVDVPTSCAPGVLIKCGDDIIIFDSADCDWSRPGFTALAHRSTKEVAFTHGVFCLEHGPDGAPLPRCRRFTHKPPLERMREYGALYNEEREAYTDSTFFFDMNVAGVLLRWFDSIGRRLEVEVDAYGDFLQALGPEAERGYIGEGGSALEVAREGLFGALRGVELQVCLCERSRFWHIGTVPEVLNHFCGVSSFLPEAAGRPDHTAAWQYLQGPEGLGYYLGAEEAVSCVICSQVEAGAAVGKRAVVEYSRVGGDCAVGGDSLVSSCELLPGTAIPPGLLVHTLPVQTADGVQFVAEVMGIEDDIKRKGNLDSVKWLGQPLAAGCERLGLEAADIWGGEEAGSLWEARLFVARKTRGEALAASLALVAGARDVKREARESFASSLRRKDGRAQLLFRRELDKAVASG